MINQKRVRRIRNIIYGLFVFLFFLPAVLMVALFFKVINLERSLDDAIANQTALSQTDETSRLDNFGLEMEEQAARPLPEQSKPEQENSMAQSSAGQDAEQVSAAEKGASQSQEAQPLGAGSDTTSSDIQAVGQQEPTTTQGSEPGKDALPPHGQTAGATDTMPNPKTGVDDDLKSGGTPDFSENKVVLNDQPNTGGPQW